MASLNFYVQGNKHLHFKVLQIKINEKQTLLWVWRLYWKTGQGRNEYFLWFVKELHNECQVMWKAWHIVQARALRGSHFIQPLHSRARSSQTTHMTEARMMMKNDFFISARYRLIRLLLTANQSKNLSTKNSFWVYHTRLIYNQLITQGHSCLHGIYCLFIIYFTQ